MYQETSQIHLNLSSIERTKDKKSNGHLSSISPAKGQMFSLQWNIIIFLQNRIESIVEGFIG